MRRLSRGLMILTPAVMLAIEPMLRAQQAPPSDPPAATVQPSTPDTSRPTSRPATTQITLHYKDAPLDAVLQQLSEEAGFVVVKTGSVSTDGRVTIWSDQPLSPAETVTVLNTVLKDNGYTLIQRGRILKILSRSSAKTESIPVHFGADPAGIPMTDDLITQVIPVRSVDAVKLKTDLQPLVGSDTDLTANAGSNSIILTDTSANIHRVAEIISNLDKHDADQSSIRVRQLKYADATAAAKLITDIFSPTDQTANNNVPPQLRFFQNFRGGFGGGGFGGRGGPGGGAPGAGGAGGDEEAGHTGKIVTSSDQRTNTVVVTGPADTLKIIDSVLDQIDANPAADQSFFLYKVKNGQAVDIAATLNSLFGGTGTSNTTNNRSSINSSTGNRNSSINGSSSNRGGGGFGGGGGGGGFGGGGGGFGGGGGGFGGGGGGFGGGGFGGNTANRGTTGAFTNRGNVGGIGGAAGASGTSAISDLIGQVLVVADSDTNSLLVATATKYQDQIVSILKDLDRPVPQVLIKALLAEVTHDNADDLGLDFSILNLRAPNFGGAGTAGHPAEGQTLGSNLGNAGAAAANGGLAVSILESNLTATFHALATQGKVDVLSRPYILASDNQEATITVGQEVPFITNSRTDTLGGITNTVTYQDIGIILDVTPHINPDGDVTMQVAPQISAISEQTVAISAGVNSPVFDLRSATTYVQIKDGETIVIGGLMQDQKNQSVTKIPILGSLPWVGPLFQRNSVTKTKTELLIFLTPHVAQQVGRLSNMTQDEMKGVKLTPSAVEPGTFDDHMRGMQRGGTDPSSQSPSPGAVPPAIPNDNGGTSPNQIHQ